MKKGFTLIELIVVIVILGILSGIAIPIFIDMSTEAKEASARASLGGIRSAIGLAYGQSALTTGGSPVYPANITGAMFADGRIPENPINGLNAVDNTWDGTAAADNLTGWQYHPATGRIRLNSTGNDSDGTPWVNY